MPIAQRHQVGTLQIGSDLPLSGDDAVDGVPVRDAIMLALSESGSVCGASSHSDACVAITPLILDDVNKGIHDPAKGAQNVKQLADNARVVGMVGPLYDSLARSEMPIANLAGLPMISPANTDVCLTQEPADGQCQGLAARLRPRSPNSFFRVVSTELIQGPAAADVAYHQLGKRRASVVEGQTALAKALATGFSDRFRHDGGKLVEQTDADVVYFAGSDLLAAASLRKQMAATAASPPLIGTDALASDQFARAAGLAARGSYYTVVGPYPPGVNSAARFRADYRKRYGRDPGTTDLAAYDATGVLLSAISRAVDDAGGKAPTRAQVLSELSHTSGYAGAMGQFGFDAHGDTTLQLISVFQWLAPADRSGRFTVQVNVRR